MGRSFFGRARTFSGRPPSVSRCLQGPFRCANVMSHAPHFRNERPGLPEVNASTARKIPAALLPACFLLLHLHDPYAGRDHGMATFILCGLFLALAASAFRGLAPDRGDGDVRPVGTGLAARGLSLALCAGSLLFHLFPRVHTPGWIMVFALAAYGLFLVTLFLPGRPAPALMSALACLFLALLASPQPYQGAPLFPVRTVFFHTVVLLSFGVLILCAAANLRGRIVLAACVVSGVLLRFVSMGQWEINGIVRDMLPLIESALAAAMDGRNPYGLHFVTHDVALTYLPVMWLSYLPAWVAGVDIRWINVLFAALCAVLIYRWGAPGDAGGRARAWHERLLPSAVGPLFLAGAVLFTLQSEIFWNSIHGEPPAYWLWLALFLTCVVTRLMLPAAVLLGIVVATRHFGVLLVPFFALWLRIAGFSWKELAARLLVTGLAASVLIVPWMMLNPDAFLYGTVEWLASYGPAYRPAWDYQVGFQSFFYREGMADHLFVIQWAAYAAVLAAASVLSLRALRSGGRERAEKILWTGCAAAYLVFVLFGNMVWKSFFVSVLMAALVPFAPFRELSPVPLLKGRSVLRRALVTGLVAVNLLSVFFTVRALHGWRDRSDIAKFAGEVAAGLRPTDLLVDYSYFNAWHVFQGSAFHALGTMPFIMTTSFPRNLELVHYGRIVVFDGYGAHDFAWEFPDLEGTFEKTTDEVSGRSRVVIYKSPAVFSEAWRLSSHPDALTEAVFESPKPPTIAGRKIGDNFLFPGLDSWIFVGPYDCRVGGTAHGLIFSQLLEGKSLTLTVENPGEGDLWLFTAADDRVFTRPRHPVRIVVTSGSERKELLHTGVRGLLTWYLGPLPGKQIHITFEARKGSLGSLCFNLAQSR
jgi:hypothetical protein